MMFALSTLIYQETTYVLLGTGVGDSPFESYFEFFKRENRFLGGQICFCEVQDVTGHWAQSVLSDL